MDHNLLLSQKKRKDSTNVTDFDTYYRNYQKSNLSPNQLVYIRKWALLELSFVTHPNCIFVKGLRQRIAEDTGTISLNNYYPRMKVDKEKFQSLSEKDQNLQLFKVEYFLFLFIKT